MKISDAVLRELIREYTREAGVRQLEREIAALTRKVTRKKQPKNKYKLIKQNILKENEWPLIQKVSYEFN